MTTSTLVTKATAAALLTAGACLAVASCASTRPYNPDHLSPDRLSQVDQVCQAVMSFKPSEALTDNLWPGDPDTPSSTNRHRGCIATLSNALTRAQATRVAKQAEQDCLSQGFVPGRSDLARCVLTVKDRPLTTTETRLAALDPKPYLISTTPRFAGTVPAQVRKEELACADVGIDPNDEAYASCTKGLKDVAWSPFLQDLYRND